MPFFIAAIGAFLARYMGSIIGTILVKIGVGVVSYVGIGYLVTNIVGSVVGLFSGINGDIAAIAGMMKLDMGLNFILSAYVAKVSVIAANNVLTKVNWSNGNVT